MRTIALSMHDDSHAETHHLRVHANAAQRTIRLREVFLPKNHPILSSNSIDALEACQQAYMMKPSFRLGDDDLLVVVTAANIHDTENDEYFSISSIDYRSTKRQCPGVAIVSLYYRDTNSAFTKSAKRHKSWAGRPAAWRDHILSGSVLLTLLSVITEQIAQVRTHEVTRGCIMDFCQKTLDIRKALEEGFNYCEKCQRQLVPSDEGQALIEIARRLTARPLHTRSPRIFISYSRVETKRARRLWKALNERGYDEVFLDEKRIGGGKIWPEESRRRLRASDFVILCLSSRGLARQGFFDEELKLATHLMKTKPKVFLIPVRFDECQPPKGLTRINYVNLYPEWETAVDKIATSMAGYR